MSKINSSAQNKDKKFEEGVRLAGGAGQLAAKQDNLALLRRAVLTSLLWENVGYESGDENAKNIAALIPTVDPKAVAELAFECRDKQKLRHVPLFIAREMARYPSHNAYLGNLLPRIITRADQITDFVALYFKDKRQPLTAQVKRGLAACFYNFKEYHFAKYNRDTPVKFRDVLFLCHAKPNNAEQDILFKKIINNTLVTPDTWEVALSGGQDKCYTFCRLIEEKKLGALAFLRNLRNMKEAKVPYEYLKQGFDNLSGNVLLPLNYYSAYKNNTEFTREIEDAMLKSYSSIPKMPGHSVFVVDVSGSMAAGVSSNSQYRRMEVAAALSMLAAELSERVTIYVTAGSDGRGIHKTERIGAHRGFALSRDIIESQGRMGRGGIFTRQCVNHIGEELANEKVDRLIVFSDSQDCDHKNKTLPNFFARNNYIVDVSAHKHGVNYKGTWTAEVSGWSENFLTFIGALEGISNMFEE